MPKEQDTLPDPDPSIFYDNQRDYFAHPLNCYGRCQYLYNGGANNGSCPPAIAVETAYLLTQPFSYLSTYAVSVLGLTLGPLVTTAALLVPLITAVLYP
jgi:hypothetical protein